MNWKIYLAGFVSFLAVSFPANIIGCGADADPYDYYISFFQDRIAETSSYEPFYYTSFRFLYGSEEDTRMDALSTEWANYCGSEVTAQDAGIFISSSSIGYLDSLDRKIDTRKRIKNVDKLQVASMEKYFLKSKDSEALQYLVFAKKAERYVVGEEWEVRLRDSLAMDSLIINGRAAFAKAKKDFTRLRYAYQLVRLAHYSKRYKDAIQWYDDYVSTNTSSSILQPLSLALKAGALYRSGKEKEAAYLFSKAFFATDVKRISNYMGFVWSTNNGESRETYLSLCNNQEEKAAMLTLFALGSTGTELQVLKEIYGINPASNAFEVLVAREINKLEENYLTPVLKNQKGGIHLLDLYYTYDSGESSLPEKKREIHDLGIFLADASFDKKTKNAGLFGIAAAHAFLMISDYPAAKKCLESASKLKLSPKLKDQWELTNLLLTVNERKTIDAAFEQQILPSLKWLQGKAMGDSANSTTGEDLAEWKFFYRSLLGQVLAKGYHQQGDLHKEVLVIGAADKVYSSGDYNTAGNFLQRYLLSNDVIALYNLLIKNNKTEFESYLVNFNNMAVGDVINFAGTVCLRENNFAAAVDWFSKGNPSNAMIDTDPFIDLLYDQVEAFENEKSTTKLDFALEMLRLERLVLKDRKNSAKYYYKLALGLYNMSYYGHAPQLVAYNRSGNELYSVFYDNKDFFTTAGSFQREYYGCFKAHDYFKKAMDNSADKNFKARCLFMMAKCDQKPVQQDFTKFKNSRYFPQLIKNYSNTPFYKEAFNSCSYLRDFVAKRK